MKEPAGPDTAGPDAIGSQTAGHEAFSPDAIDSQTAGPEAAGSDAFGPDAAGPDTGSIFSLGITLLFVWLVLFFALVRGSPALAAPAAGILILAHGGRLWSRAGLARLSLLPETDRNRLFPGETVRFRVVVENRKPLPVWVRIELQASRDVLAGEELLRGETVLRPYGRVRRSWSLAALRRGVYTIGPARISAGDLLGFHRRSRAVPFSREIVVFPRLPRLRALDLPFREFFGLHASRGAVEDPAWYAGTRDYRGNRPARNIHWKASARLGVLQEKLFEPTSHRKVMFVLDADGFSGESGFAGPPGPVSGPVFEAAAGAVAVPGGGPLSEAPVSVPGVRRPAPGAVAPSPGPVPGTPVGRPSGGAGNPAPGARDFTSSGSGVSKAGSGAAAGEISANGGESPSGGAPGPRDLELLIEVLASSAREVMESGSSFGFLTNAALTGDRPPLLPLGRGPEHLGALLEMLARVEGRPRDLRFRAQGPRDLRDSGSSREPLEPLIRQAVRGGTGLVYFGSSGEGAEARMSAARKAGPRMVFILAPGLPGSPPDRPGIPGSSGSGSSGSGPFPGDGGGGPPVGGVPGLQSMGLGAVRVHRAKDLLDE